MSLSLCRSESNTFYFVTLSSYFVLSPYLVWRFFGTIGISHTPRCYGNQGEASINIATCWPMKLSTKYEVNVRQRSY